MDLGIRGRVALVAAASRGLGRATAQALSHEGVRVAIVARGEQALRAAAREIAAETGGQVLAVNADVSAAEDIATMVDAVVERWGRIDILVNNAGGPKPGEFTDMEDADWLDAVQLNLMSAIRLTRAVLAGMRERRWGRIINLTSISVKQPLPNLILSNTARAGVVGMAKTLAGQVAAEGITVNNICPGYILTDRVREVARASTDQGGRSIEQAIQDIAGSIPVGRLGRPEELGALVAFLASEQAAYITGATIQIDGGMYRGLL
jgi:3-oxoacyl-[acyl-carrier protein] reductase